VPLTQRRDVLAMGLPCRRQSPLLNRLDDVADFRFGEEQRGLALDKRRIADRGDSERGRSRRRRRSFELAGLPGYRGRRTTSRASIEWRAMPEVIAALQAIVFEEQRWGERSIASSDARLCCVLRSQRERRDGLVSAIGRHRVDCRFSRMTRVGLRNARMRDCKLGRFLPIFGSGDCSQ